VGRRPSPGVILAVVSFGVFIAADDLTVVSTMLRQIIGDLGIPLPEGFDRAAWIVNSYLVAYVAVMPFMGRLSDVIGRRRVYLGALTLFLIGSIWIPLAPNLSWFVAGRVITAIGGGAMVPVALAVIGDVYENIPLAAIGIAVTWWALRDHDRPRERRRIDWPAALSLSVTLVCLNVALVNTGQISAVSELAELTGDTSVPTVPFFVAAAISFALFLWFETRSRDPVIDLRLFRTPNFAPAILVNFLIGAVLIIAMVDVPLFVNLVVETNLEKAAVLSGWILSALTASMAVAAYAGGRLTEITWYRPVVIGGLVFVAAGFLVMGITWDEDVTVWHMAWNLVLLGIGFGVMTAPTNAAAVDTAPADRRGVAGGLVILARLMGLAVGLSGLTAWALHRFDTLRRTIDLPPLDSPGYREALEQAQAGLTSSALSETFLFSAALAAAAIPVALWLRRRSSPAESP